MKEKMFKLKQTILIADDSEMNRSLLADMLGNEFEILEAENGVQAVAYMQNEGSRIDLVLLDIVMPKMDGFEVLAVMNRNDWIKDTPVIMISSEMTEILRMSDRIVVMCEGRKTGELDIAEATQERIMHAATLRD